MLTPRFHCTQAVPGLARGTRVELPPDASHHALRVLRLREGQPVAVFCGHGGEYEAVLEAGRGRSAQVLLGAFHAGDRAPRIDVHVQQSVVATEKMDWVVEKAVELGARRFTPVLAERSVVRLSGERAAKRAAHWQALAVSASEQCGLNRLLEVCPVMALDAACAGPHDDGALLCVLDPEGERSLTQELSVLLANPAGVSARSLVLLIGPEGGFSPVEAALARAAGYRPVTLGPRVLRTETAALAALAALRAIVDDFSPPVPPNPRQASIPATT